MLFGRLGQTLAVGLVVFAMAFLVACEFDQDTESTEGPQPTATSAARETPSPTMPPVQVVTTTNFVADWARVVGGRQGGGLQPAASGWGDPHHFQPGPRDVARVADADLVLSVGLYLEAAWLEELLHNASADESKIVALGESVDPIEFAMDDMRDDHGDEGDGNHGDHEGHAHGTFDPHFWFDPIRVKIAVNEISRSAFGYRTSERECLLPERLSIWGEARRASRLGPRAG